MIKNQYTFDPLIITMGVPILIVSIFMVNYKKTMSYNVIRCKLGNFRENSFFARISFSRRALKDIFVFKNGDKGMINLYQ